MGVRLAEGRLIAWAFVSKWMSPKSDIHSLYVCVADEISTGIDGDIIGCYVEVGCRSRGILNTRQSLNKVGTISTPWAGQSSLLQACIRIPQE